MKKTIFLIIIFFLIFVGAGFKIYFSQIPKIPKEISQEELEKSLSSIILKNTKFKEFRANGFYLKYPDWTKIEIDPLTIWPKEIAEKEKILLYLTNADEVTILVTKREINSEDLTKPFPSIFRKFFEEEKKIMEEKGGLTYYQITKMNLFDNEVTLETKSVILSKNITSISKSVIFKKFDRGLIYSVGVSASDQIFEVYRLLANYIIDSVRYY